MTLTDIVVGALTAWRENRGGGRVGMQSVINSFMNEAKARRCGIYEVCTFPLRYSSITYKHDPQLAVWPHINDDAFLIALQLMDAAAKGQLPDITDGATNYYAESMSEAPYWADHMQYVCTVAGHRFYKPLKAA